MKRKVNDEQSHSTTLKQRGVSIRATARSLEGELTVGQIRYEMSLDKQPFLDMRRAINLPLSEGSGKHKEWAHMSVTKLISYDVENSSAYRAALLHALSATSEPLEFDIVRRRNHTWQRAQGQTKNTLLVCGHQGIQPASSV